MALMVLGQNATGQFYVAPATHEVGFAWCISCITFLQSYASQASAPPREGETHCMFCMKTTLTGVPSHRRLYCTSQVSQTGDYIIISREKNLKLSLSQSLDLPHSFLGRNHTLCDCSEPTNDAHILLPSWTDTTSITQLMKRL